jgi:predicted short-subunit dehydrogenase-like oxidoreductase (DUF2520 family)
MSWHQRADAALFAEERTALDRIDPERGALDAGAALRREKAERDQQQPPGARSLYTIRRMRFRRAF